ncbi:MAG: arginine deiminase family protein [Candidatus Hodarchaeota archaeon]
MAQITFASYQELAFRDVVYSRRFQAEHDDFTDLLREENIDVILLNELLSEQDLACANPNMVYVRDTCTITNAGFVQMRIAPLVRTAEPMLVAKSLGKLGIPHLLSINSPGLLEGGDLVYPDDSTLMIGYGPRSNEDGVMQIVKAALNKVVDTIVLVPLPSWRVHLDGGLMFVDRDLLIYHPASVETFPVRVLHKDKPLELMPLLKFIKENFDPETIPISNNELYLFGANILCLARRKCVAYEWNERIIEELLQRSVEVLTIQGGELARGGGGPHCMTLPICRKK